MEQSVFDTINSNKKELNRSLSRKWILESISLNPNVIIITNEAEDWNGLIPATIKNNSNGPFIIDINSDLSGLNKKGLPIIFDSYLITK